MKFAVKATASTFTGRRGVLTGFKRLPDVAVDTPGCLLFTRCGSVPHLSRDVLQKIENLPSIVSMSMSTLSDYQDSVRECEAGLADFCCMKDSVIFCTTHDVSEPICKFNCSTNKTLPIRNRSGNKNYNAESFLKVLEAFQCDAVQILADNEANPEMIGRKKRMDKAYNRSVDFLENFINFSKGSQIEDTPIFASIVGGVMEESRTQCAKESQAKAVSGFVLEGFHSYDHKSEIFWDVEEHIRLVQNTLSCLPSEKPRYVGGSLHPLAVLSLVKAGVDLFDTSYTYQVTSRGGALSFPFKLDAVDKPQPADRMFELNLNDEKYKEQVDKPILSGCKCYTCKNFTRGYLNHLLNTRELLSGVLLSIHNLHHYLRFFEHLRENADGEYYSKLEALLKDYRGQSIDYDKEAPTREPSITSEKELAT